MIAKGNTTQQKIITIHIRTAIKVDSHNGRTRLGHWEAHEDNVQSLTRTCYLSPDLFVFMRDIGNATREMVHLRLLIKKER